MGTKALKPLPPQPHIPIVSIDANGQVVMAQAWIEYLTSLDLVNRNALFGLLTNAANDAAALAAGVPLNGLYRNGNAVQIRLT